MGEADPWVPTVGLVREFGLLVKLNGYYPLEDEDFVDGGGGGTEEGWMGKPGDIRNPMENEKMVAIFKSIEPRVTHLGALSFRVDALLNPEIHRADAAISMMNPNLVSMIEQIQAQQAVCFQTGSDVEDRQEKTAYARAQKQGKGDGMPLSVAKSIWSSPAFSSCCCVADLRHHRVLRISDKLSIDGLSYFVVTAAGDNSIYTGIFYASDVHRFGWSGDRKSDFDSSPATPVEIYNPPDRYSKEEMAGFFSLLGLHSPSEFLSPSPPPILT